nr:PAS domain-containing sensor histidine kinase [Pseudopedobacter sp.]
MNLNDKSINTNEGVISISKDLFENLKQLENFFKYTPDLLCIASFDGYFKRVNPAVSKVLGYSDEELYSKKIMQFVHPDDLENTILHRLKMIKGETPGNHENRYVTKSGEIVWLSWTSIPDDDLRCVFAIAKVITAKKEREEERNKLLENISSVNQELKHFTRLTSHDLRSPVNNILSIFDLLDTSKITDTNTLELVSLLKSTTHQLHQTLETYINGLIKKDKELNQENEDINIETSLNKVIQSIKALIQKSHAIITTNFSAFDKINYNQIYLESVLLNLITNAIKYAHPARLPIIDISTRILNDKKQIIVSDNGSGFDLDQVKGKVFGLHETFHQNKDSKGLGLYLVHKNVTDLGGKIHLESKLGEGSSFIITFKH